MRLKRHSNLIKFYSAIIKSNFSRLKLPYKLTFALTYKCDLKCKICQIWSKKQENELSAEEIGTFFKQNHSFSWIDLTGGEIFLRPDIDQIFDHLLYNCRSLVLLHFPTNGQFPDKVISLVKRTVKKYTGLNLVITVSLDGPKELNDQIRGKDGAWLKALETFRRLKELGVKNVYLGYTISKYNQGKLNDTIAAIRQIYPKISYADFHVNTFAKSEHYFNNHKLDNFQINDAIRAELSQYLMHCGSGIKRFLERKFVDYIPGYGSKKINSMRCQALSGTCFIDPCGDIYPCLFFGSKLSNIKDINNHYDSFWNDPKMITVYENIVRSKCSGCWSPCEAYPALLGNLSQIWR